MTGAKEMTTALGGVWSGSHGMARCPAHPDRTPSLAIRDAGGAVLVHCHAGCPQDEVLDNLRAMGLWASSKSRASALFAAAPRDDADRSAAALAVWRSSQSAEGSPVATYLRSRGIVITVPQSIRFHPSLKHRDTGLRLPCMVAGVQDAAGRVVAIHRTFLTADGQAKAPVTNNKMMLGPCAGGAVRFTTAGRKLAIGEGIESCISVRQQCPDLAVWAALSAPGLKRVGIPDYVNELVILADGDEPGEQAAQALAARPDNARRKVKIARPPAGQDFNDLLLSGSRQAQDG